MSIITLKRPPHQKPLLGTPIDWSHPLSRGLVGCWVMNEGAGNRIYNLSPNGNNGVGTGNPIWLDNAINFDGTYRFSTVGNSKVFETLPYSVAFGFYSDLIGGDVNFNILSKDKSFGSKGWWFGSSQGDFPGEIRFGTHTGNIKTSGVTSKIWYDCILVQLDADTAYIYIDGILNSSGDNGFDGHAVDNPFIIGTKQGDTNRFVGKIRYVYAYNRVLVQQESTQIHIDPYQMFMQPRVYYSVSGFQAAWAINSNIIIQPGISA